METTESKTTQDLVLEKFSRAYIHKVKGSVEVRRPRTKNDPPALVPYVLLSKLQLTDLSYCH
jgi:hypothetical protein